MKRLTLITLILTLFTFTAPCWAANIDFAWDANSETDLAGYRLFQRTADGNYDYAVPIAEIPAGTEVCTVADIPDGDYRWVLRAFDLAGNVSGDSNECSLAIDDSPGVVTGFG